MIIHKELMDCSAVAKIKVLSMIEVIDFKKLEDKCEVWWRRFPCGLDVISDVHGETIMTYLTVTWKASYKIGSPFVRCVGCIAHRTFTIIGLCVTFAMT